MAAPLVALLGACAPARQAPDEPASERASPRNRTLIARAWLIEGSDGRTVAHDVRTTLLFQSEERVDGSGGCNRYFASPALEGPRLGIGKVASTRMACAPAVMDQETRLLQALQSTRTYRLEGKVMRLLDAGGRPRVRLSRIDPGSETAPAPRAGTGRQRPLTDFVFICSDGPDFILRTVNEGTVEVELPERVLRLERERGASGVRYRADDDVVVWTRGREATLALGGERHECSESRPQSLLASARSRGVVFRATGNEPGWVLEIFPERLELDADYGRRRAVTPRPPPEQDVAGTSVYHAVTEAHDLRVRIEVRECRDSMSGRRFPATVTVELDGRRYRGCGQYLQPSSHGPHRP